MYKVTYYYKPEKKVSVCRFKNVFEYTAFVEFCAHFSEAYEILKIEKE